MTTRTFRFLATAAIAALVVTTFTAASGSSAATPPQRAPLAARDNYAVPKVGTCHLYSKKQAFQSSAPRGSVPCTEKHTTLTLSVRRLTGKVDWNDTLGLFKRITRQCENAEAKALGSNDKMRAMTAFEYVWFKPTPREIKRGAKWLRCDLVLAGGSRLMPLPTDPTLTQITEDVRRCVGDSITVCTRPHQHRAVGAFRLAGPRPNERQANAAAGRGCRPFVDGTNFSFSYPDVFAWAAGSRAMVCYVRHSG